MSGEVWGSGNGETWNTETIVIKCGERTKEVPKNSPFSETVRAVASEWGLGTFKVVARLGDGDAKIISPSTAPEDFSGFVEIEIFPYDKAGLETQP